MYVSYELVIIVFLAKTQYLLQKNSHAFATISTERITRWRVDKEVLDAMLNLMRSPIITMPQAWGVRTVKVGGEKIDMAHVIRY